MKSDCRRMLAALSCVVASGCGGGGDGGGGAPPADAAANAQVRYVAVCHNGATATSSASQADAEGRCPLEIPPLEGTGIAGVSGSVCAWVNRMGGGNYPRVLDLDGKGYVAWAVGRVRCATPDGQVQDIAGLAQSAFSFTGNGATQVPPEDLVEGQAGSDQQAVYTAVNYRSFATEVAMTAKQEQVTVSGRDAAGRWIEARGDFHPARYVWDARTGDGGGTAAASRVFHADNQGYEATTWLVVNYAAPSNWTGPCPPDEGVKQIDARGMRHCLYTGLKNFSYVNPTGGWISDVWALDNGTPQKTPPHAMSIRSAQLVAQSAAGNRVPLYKLASSISYPRPPTRTWLSDQLGIGSMFVHMPVFHQGTYVISRTAPMGWPD